MPADVLVDLSTAMAIIGVMIALFLRADRRIDEVEARSESRFGEMDARLESRMDEVDARFDRVDARLESRLDEVDARFDRVDARFDVVDARFDRVDARFESMARDIVEVKVSVARIEGYLQAGEGFRPAGRDQPVSQADIDQPPTSYRQAG